MNGAAIAIMAAGLLSGACDKKQSAGPAPSSSVAPSAASANVSAEKTAKIFCGGVNECAGKSACMTATNGCRGQNSCKGKGVLEMTEDECRQKGGTVHPKTM